MLGILIDERALQPANAEFPIDVTEFVKQQAAKGKTTVTFAIDAQTIEGGLGFNTSESTLDNSVKPCLAWK